MHKKQSADYASDDSESDSRNFNNHNLGMSFADRSPRAESGGSTGILLVTETQRIIHAFVAKLKGCSPIFRVIAAL
jgi:hypothetical protein